MTEVVQNHLAKALEEYTGDEHYKTLLAAKEKYFELTGSANEDDEDYESKMACFNDWYLLQFIPRLGSQTAIEEYLDEHQLESELANAISGFNHTLFEYLGTNFQKRYVLRDIVNKKKVALVPNHPSIALVKEDIFIGRVVVYKNEGYLLNGRCPLPRESKSILKKESAKIRKLKDDQETLRFLLKTELLNTKWMRYGHIEVSKIFIF